MINLEKVAIYRKFAGDIDGWARMASAAEKAMLTGDDWRQIDSFVQDFGLVKAGLASARYAEKLHARIVESITDAETLAALKELVEQLA
ncbi:MULTISPECIES: hypothetical protein [Methylomonas]|uniref:Uncharacterized protein n=2 Tax=Methylomonas TaxID=416 RepID=A0A126T6A9_9GAMM|nr:MULTISPECIES: hypothetical protein [Methylomonas]AMK77605.1 hypothetical protein JT25_014125 [Methylomonas denitrificans]OAI05182.1 hypothetical protein A1342_12290 [Methylomonas methanica]TCV84350.1 hypothetical protein EDE11_1076 [Methylomonas methanica]